MKKFLVALVLALMASVAFAQSADTTAVSGSNSGASALNSGNTLQNYFASGPSSTYGKYDYAGSYTVKTNSSIAAGAYAPSMSGYNCAQTGQAGGSSATAGVTAILGVPLLMDPGKLCVFFTLGNMNLQMYVALAQRDPVEAQKHLVAQDAIQCLTGDVYPEIRRALRESGNNCAITKDEREVADKAGRRYDATKGGPILSDDQLDDICSTNQVCRDKMTARAASAAFPVH